jgi:hypothetical protein
MDALQEMALDAYETGSSGSTNRYIAVDRCITKAQKAAARKRPKSLVDLLEESKAPNA